MTETLDPMDQPKIDPQQVAQQLLAQARTDGVELVGPNGLLNQLTATVLETALEAEMDEHLGYEKHQVEGRNSGNSRNGRRSKTVLTEIGPVQIQVPRDTDASFDPQIVKKRQRRLTGVDEIILSLSAKGLTTGEIAAHFDDVYSATVSKETISKITDKVLAQMAEWSARPLDPVYPVLFIDAIHVKVRDGQVTNRPVYVAIGVTVDGHRDILGLWAGDGGEGAKFWLAVLTEIKNRGTGDVCIVVCDGLKGLPEAITAVWDRAIVQTCVIHLLRNTFRYASRRYWDEMSRDLRPIYTAVTEAAASERFEEFAVKWGPRYPATIAQPVPDGAVVAFANVKGGVGKTPMAISLAETLGEYRGPATATCMDLGEVGGSFADRVAIPPAAGQDVVSLLADLGASAHQVRASTLARYLTRQPSGSYVVAGASGAAAPLSFEDAAVWGSILERHYDLLLADTGNSSHSGSWRWAITAAHAVVVPVPLRRDAAVAAQRTLAAISAVRPDVLPRTVVVITEGPGDAPMVETEAVEAFAVLGVPVCRMPFEPLFASGERIVLGRLRGETRDALTMLAATVVARIGSGAAG